MPETDPTPLTVAELIAVLQGMPQGLPVVIHYGEDGATDVTSNVQIIEVVRNVNRGSWNGPHDHPHTNNPNSTKHVLLHGAPNLVEHN